MPDFFEKKQEQLWVRSKPLVTKNAGDTEEKGEGEEGGEEKPSKKEQKE